MTSSHATGVPIPESRYRLPLAVAVTGHRDIAPQDEARLRDQLRKRFASLRRRFPATPLLALSGLAEGADMLFAETALELHIRLVAVLPAPAAAFAKDFEKPAHPARDPEHLRQRFEKLLEHCADVVVVSNGRLAEDPRRHTFVGAYLVRRCHILFALWDGDDSEEESGTGHVVRLAREGVPNRYRESPSRVLDAPDAITIHHLRTPRRGAPLQDAFTWRISEPTQCATPPCRQNLSSPLDHLEAFNKAAAEFSATHDMDIRRARQCLNVTERDLHATEKRILDAFALADAMAIALQRHARHVLDIIYGISGMMLLLFAVHTNVMANRGFYLLYYLIFVSGYFLYSHADKQRIHHRFVDYRGLAEGLRVQLFFHLTGVHTLAADLYLRKQRADLTWIRQTMRVLEIGSRRKTPLTDIVVNCWIKDQCAYFGRSETRDRKKILLYERIASIVFDCGLIVGAIGLVLELMDATLHDSDVLHWAFMLTGLLAAAGALASSYAYHRGLAQHIREYAKMRDMFCHAATLIEKDDLSLEPYAFRTLVQELGKESLAESGQWVLHHREIPPDLPSK